MSFAIRWECMWRFAHVGILWGSVAHSPAQSRRAARIGATQLIEKIWFFAYPHSYEPRGRGFESCRARHIK